MKLCQIVNPPMKVKVVQGAIVCPLLLIEAFGFAFTDRWFWFGVFLPLFLLNFLCLIGNTMNMRDGYESVGWVGVKPPL